jgi:hypothetical protein
MKALIIGSLTLCVNQSYKKLWSIMFVYSIN